MTQGFYTGISGISSNQFAIDVTADNIANVNNVGFKSSSTEFGNLFENSLVTASGSSPIDNTVGVGSRIQATTVSMLQGSIINSDRSTDLALGGNGWFGVEGVNGMFFTRNGEFTFDSNRDFVTGDGYFVQGTLANNIASGTIVDAGVTYNTSILTPLSINTPLADVSAQTKINLPNEVYLPPQPTSYVKFFGNIGFEGTTTTYPRYVDGETYEVGNGMTINVEDYNIIDSDVIVDETAVQTGDTRLISLKRTAGPPSFLNGVLQNDNDWVLAEVKSDAIARTISTTVISAENEKNKLSMEFIKSDIQPLEGVSWDAVAKISRTDSENVYDDEGNIIDTVLVETVYDEQAATLMFDGTGALIENSFTTLDNNGVELTLNLGVGYDGIVSTGPETSLGSKEDGIPGGWLDGYTFTEDGNIMASFDNSFTTSVGKLAVYHFQNDQGLERAGADKFNPSSDSGEPIFWQDQNGDNFLGAHLYSGKLEASNVRLDIALTDLIVLQKAYNANSKSITTGDELIKKALDMKR